MTLDDRGTSAVLESGDYAASGELPTTHDVGDAAGGVLKVKDEFDGGSGSKLDGGFAVVRYMHREAASACYANNLSAHSELRT
jgi:hypothetical protein